MLQLNDEFAKIQPAPSPQCPIDRLRRHLVVSPNALADVAPDGATISPHRDNSPANNINGRGFISTIQDAATIQGHHMRTAV
jgi:hypothetical protein